MADETEPETANPFGLSRQNHLAPPRGESIGLDLKIDCLVMRLAWIYHAAGP